MPDRDITDALTTHSPDPDFVASTREMLSAAWFNPDIGPREPEPSDGTASEATQPETVEPQFSQTSARPTMSNRPTSSGGPAKRPTRSQPARVWAVPAAAAAVIVLGGVGMMLRGRDSDNNLAITPALTTTTLDASSVATVTPTTIDEPDTTVPTTAAPTTAATTTTMLPTSTSAPTTAPPSTVAVVPTAPVGTVTPVTTAPPVTTAAPATTAPVTTAPVTTAPPTTAPPTTVKDPFQDYTAAPIPPWARVAASAPVAKFPADGVYASGYYEIAGTRVTFFLEQRFLGKACWDRFANDPDVKSICSANDGWLADGQVAEPTATITADAKASVVTTFFVPPTDDQVQTYAISYNEFLAGLSGETDTVMPARDFRLLVRDGRVVSIVSMWHASFQLAPYLS